MGRKKKRRSARKRAAEQAAQSGGAQQPLAPSGQAPVAVSAEPANVTAAAPAAPPPALTPVPAPAAPPAAPDSPVVALQSAPAPQTAPSPPPESVALDADLDADLDDDASDSYESLVAQVAGLPVEAGRPPREAVRASPPADPEPAEEVVEVFDLDDDEGASDPVDRLIAQAVVDTPTEEVAPPRTRAHGAGPSAGSPSARLVQAAAAGALGKDDEPTVSLDLGEVSTPEARARLLAEALAHAEHRDARYRVPLADTRRAARWKALVSGVLFVLAGAVAVAPPDWVSPAPPAQLDAAARARGTRMALLLQAQQVEAFRVRSQRLPNSLDELPGVIQGVRYARSGNRAYQLIVYERDGNTIVYDSADPAPPFRILMSAWALAEEAP